MLYVYVNEPRGQFYTSLSIIAKDYENAQSLKHLVHLNQFKKEGVEYWQQDGWGATVEFQMPLGRVTLEKRLVELKKDIRYLRRKSKVVYPEQGTTYVKKQQQQDSQLRKLSNLYWQYAHGGIEYVLLDGNIQIPSLGLYGEVGDYLLRKDNHYMVVLSSDVKNYI